MRSPLKIKLPSPQIVEIAHKQLVQDLRLESEESGKSGSVERQMLFKYALAWHECALSFKEQ
jgi:hypothetical protein